MRGFHQAASMIAIVWVFASGQAMAQQSAQPVGSVPSASEEDGVSAGDNEIVVSGSRITRDGYEAPTPVTMVTDENLLKAAPTGISNGLVQLPQFAGSITQASENRNTPNSGRAGTTLALRGLGAIRTLILQDGFRVPPTRFDGTVNADVIPQDLIERVDIVTSGASAAYGSDAVTGVVNFVTKKNFIGLKVSLQGGISTYNDNGNYRASVTWGSKIGDRAHITLSAMRYESNGFYKSDRPSVYKFGTAAGSVVGSASSAGTAGNPLVDTFDATLNVYAAGGLIRRTVSYPASYNQLVFFANGQYRTAITGQRTGSPAVFVGPTDYQHFTSVGHQGAPQNSTQLFGRLSYDIADDVTAYVQGNYSQINMTTESQSMQTLSAGHPIFSENAFLPDALHLPAFDFTNQPAFFMSKFWPQGGNQGAKSRDTNYMIRLGLDGKTAGFDWHIAYQNARSISNNTFVNGTNLLKLAAALDAVKSPSGTIVCRPTLDPDPVIRARYADCVPLNIFGPNVESAAALEYIKGSPTYRSQVNFDAITANFSRDLFNLWAGPLTLAAGAEYRKLSLNVTSNSDPAVPRDYTGLRGIVAGTTWNLLGDTGQSKGAYNVKEAFAEVSVPILKDSAIAKSLDLNGAIRLTDYSTSGNVTTWKVGGTWDVVDGFRIRTTRSRDIRAPSLYELFQGPTSQQNSIFDPHTNQQPTVASVSAGNSALKPEIADAFSIGLVASPNFAPHFRFSVDYFTLNIANAIQQTTAALMLTECEASNGLAPICNRITRPLPFSDRTAANNFSRIQVGPENIGRLKMRGMDIDANYTTNLAGGQLAVRAIANLVFSLTKQSASTLPTFEYAGFDEGDTVPKFRGSLQVNYDIGDVGFFVQERLIGKIKRGPTLVWASPDLPTVAYTDATFTYRFGSDKERQAFFSVNNLFNRQAPLLTSSAPPGFNISTLPALYDVAGRMFTAGIRMSF